MGGGLRLHPEGGQRGGHPEKRSHFSLIGGWGPPHSGKPALPLQTPAIHLDNLIHLIHLTFFKLTHHIKCMITELVLK